ncbi:transporter [Shewanella sp. NFH-SH190041]|uniref:flippase n=1 Tax=Shewanella sp. NFH-SH190041 TaxID=2950245 RepID=UPI0021C32D86|nr:flippase [Shewanella sp. NFH-SH190041]BDM65196.1 transporter [Shewanella sp. NFH-SH190041]
MFVNLKNKFANSEENKRLISNIFSLTILQGANYILPLLTMPYLVRVLGPDYFGLLAFSSATIAYFALVTDYGFNLSATRQISIFRGDQKKVNDIFSSVMLIKIGLMFASFFVMIALVLIFDKFKDHWDLYLISFGMVVGQVIFPVWLFQGMEKMKYITYLNIGAKVIFTVCIFIFVKKQSDFLLVPFFTSLGFILSGVLSLILAKKEFKVKLTLQKFENIKFQLIEGWHIFFSDIAISLYTISNTFILGLFSNNTVVGYFSAADRIIQAVKGLYMPVSKSIYPLIGKKIHDNRRLGLLFVKKITLFVSSGMLFFSLIVFLFSEPIINIFLGEQYHQSIILLKVMSFLPFIISLSNMYGIQTMLNLGYKKQFSRILIIAAAIGLCLALILVPIYSDFGTAINLLLVEIIVTSTMYVFLKLKKVL